MELQFMEEFELCLSVIQQQTLCKNRNLQIFLFSQKEIKTSAWVRGTGNAKESMIDAIYSSSPITFKGVQSWMPDQNMQMQLILTEYCKSFSNNLYLRI